MQGMGLPLSGPRGGEFHRFNGLLSLTPPCLWSRGHNRASAVERRIDITKPSQCLMLEVVPRTVDKWCDKGA